LVNFEEAEDGVSKKASQRKWHDQWVMAYSKENETISYRDKNTISLSKEYLLTLGGIEPGI
jgi:hypothetical protein